MKELQGPASHAEWLRSWKVYSFIMVALGAVTRARVDRYASKVASLVDKYGNKRGNSWWIVALADQRMRSERMEIIRRNLEAAYTEGRLGDAGVFDPDKPWDAVFLAAANDSKFWTTEVAETAMLHIARVKDKDDLMDPGHHVQVACAAPGFGLGSGSGGFPPQPPALGAEGCSRRQRQRQRQRRRSRRARTSSS